MSKGTIYQNLWAGYTCYFVFQVCNGQYAYGLSIHNAYKKWKVQKSTFYVRDIRDDREHFPIVGHINIDELIIGAILKEVLKESSDADSN